MCIVHACAWQCVAHTHSDISTRTHINLDRCLLKQVALNNQHRHREWSSLLHDFISAYAWRQQCIHLHRPGPSAFRMMINSWICRWMYAELEQSETDTFPRPACFTCTKMHFSMAFVDTDANALRITIWRIFVRLGSLPCHINLKRIAYEWCRIDWERTKEKEKEGEREGEGANWPPSMYVNIAFTLKCITACLVQYAHPNRHLSLTPISLLLC